MELVVNGLTLSHHGIKGQKWGVRNAEWYPIDKFRANKGRARAYDALKTKDKVEDIYKSMSSKDLNLLDADGDEYMTVKEGERLVYRALQEIGDTPVAFFDIMEYDNVMNVTLGTRDGEEYRGKGYATKAAKEAVEWYDKHHEEFNNKPLSWAAKKENIGSQKVAQKAGFKMEDRTNIPEDDPWVMFYKTYPNKKKKEAHNG